MELFIVEIARYVIILIFGLYTFYSFRAFVGKNKERQNRVFAVQRTLTVLLHTVMSALLIMENMTWTYVLLWAAELVFYFVFIKVYQACYKGLSKLVLNNMMMCMMVGFVMLGRLSSDYAVHQIILAAAAMVVCLFVPLVIEKFTIWERLGWYYAVAGVLFLLLVFVIGVEKYGSRNWIRLAGITIQPSEFVKICYVFFMSSLLAKSAKFKHIVLITCAAAVHVVILVAEKDLGAALIYFITYIMVLYVATMNVGNDPERGVSGRQIAVRHWNRRIYRDGTWQRTPGQRPRRGERFYFCRYFGRTGRRVCHLSHHGVSQQLYHVCQYCNENEKTVLQADRIWSERCLYLSGIFVRRRRDEIHPFDRRDASAHQLRR